MTDRDQIFSANDENGFKQRYVIGFLTSWCAVNYSDFCSRGLHQELRQPPVEDAAHLAEEAWSHWSDIIGVANEKDVP